MNPIRWKLHWQILLSLTLATLFGALILPSAGEGFSAGFVSFCQFIGKLFMNALKMVIVPLIVASIITGVMHLGAEKGVGRMGFKPSFTTPLVVPLPSSSASSWSTSFNLVTLMQKPLLPCWAPPQRPQSSKD
jgi:Na+/H+-dicarboxylate symporter